MRRLTLEDFIERSSHIHGGKYDYSKANYKNNSTKVCIICPIHGEFWQSPQGHMSGKGCVACSRVRANEKRRTSTDKFIDVARKVHGDRYDYSKVEYIDSTTKVRIVCKEHGEFWQVPNYHISGCGCPKCGSDSHIKHNMSNSRIYKAHSGMLGRCNNPNNHKYKCYGGRGIRVCEDWLKFENFYEWAVNNGYKEGLTLERINVNGNYEPTNCKWISRRRQYYNKQDTKYIDIHGKQISIVELRDVLNIKRGIIEYRLQRYGNDSVVSFLEKNYSETLKQITDEN